jgi:hypothetical protein
MELRVGRATATVNGLTACPGFTKMAAFCGPRGPFSSGFKEVSMLLSLASFTGSHLVAGRRSGRAHGLALGGLLALVFSTSCGGTAIRPKSDAATNVVRADGAEPDDGAGPDGSNTGSGGAAAGGNGGSGGTSSASGGAPGTDAASDDASANDDAGDGATDAASDGAAGPGPGDATPDGVIGDAAADAAAGGTTGAGGAGGAVSGAGGAGGATAGAGGATAGAGGTVTGAGGATAGAGGTATGTGGATAGAGGATTGAGGTGVGGSTADGPVADAAPATDAIVTCGGVRCPALFNLVATCRPTGACIRGGNVSATLSCYDNGVRVRSHLELGRGLVIDVTKPDGVSPCYSMDVGVPTGGGLRPAVVHSPDGTEIARGLADPNDGGLVTVTCDGVTADLQDRSCLVDPGVGNCAAGTCQ